MDEHPFFAEMAQRTPTVREGQLVSFQDVDYPNHAQYVDPLPGRGWSNHFYFSHLLPDGYMC